MGKHIHLFEKESSFNTAYNGGRYIKPWASWTKSIERADYNKPDDPYLHVPFTIEALSSGNITWSLSSDTVSYNKNDTSWQTMNRNTTISVVEGDKIQFKGSNASYNYKTISSTAQFNVKGNIMSLTDGDDFETATAFRPAYSYMDYASSTFSSLFSRCTTLISASDLKLPVTTLATSCYSSMFYGCTNLIEAPKLPATTLASSCYNSMFSGCTSLTATPELGVMTLENSCYNLMFYNCTSLTTITELPATKLADRCYSCMFKGCTSITTAPELPATKLASYCYEQMFNGCTGLTETPELPATKLASYCYEQMFNGCTGLTETPELHATTLADYCYSQMFSSCTSLTTAPDLPATTLADCCYKQMFNGCTSLTESPELPATTLAYDCYCEMFKNCTSITASPELPATTLESYCYNSMFSGCTNLATAPELPATTAKYGCYRYMFNGCTSLATAPELPATNVETFCYQNMFDGCTSLTTAPDLPAMTLGQSSYSYMFSGCTNLTTAPELPATTLASSCYDSMFKGCASLTTAPELLATTLAYSCYAGMFQNCSSLNYIKCLATNIGSYSTTNWVSGVSATGTFVSDPSANWTIGVNGIPSGWSCNIFRIDTTSFNTDALGTTLNLSGYCGYNNWTITNNLSWITPSVSSGSTGNISVNIVTQNNTTSSSREGTFNISVPSENLSIPITVVQDAPSLTISKSSFQVPLSGSTISISGRSTYSTNWSLTNNESWITDNITSYSPGDINFNLTIAQGSSERTGVVYVTCSGQTIPITIVQEELRGYYSVDLVDGDWIVDTLHTGPSGETVYKSDYNYHESADDDDDYNYATMSITITDYSEFTIYVRTNGEDGYDYLVVSQLDKTPSYSDNPTVNKWFGDGQASSSTWSEVTFTNIPEGTHIIRLNYYKDDSGHQGEDRGFVYIPSRYTKR